MARPGRQLEARERFETAVKGREIERDCHRTVGSELMGLD